jgi:DNA polymerase-3 subunit delta'
MTVNIDDTFQMVKRALDAGRPANGYLIVGPVRGLAMDLAVRILQTLFCKADAKPCGACDGCRHVAGRLEADIHWIFPEKKSRVISAEQVREKLLHEVTQTSFAGGWKAGVLVGADRLNEASANVFLKTLEEPPERTLFLLLTDAPQQLLPTVVSRCQRIDLDTARDLAEPWKSRVVETLASPLLRHPIEKLAMSNVLFSILADIKGKAQQLVEEEDAGGEVAEEDDKEVFEARVSARYRELRTDFLLALMRWFRDLLVLKTGGGAELVYNRSRLDVLRERSGRLTLAQALYNLNAVEELARQMERNLSEETLLAHALDRAYHGVA